MRVVSGVVALTALAACRAEPDPGRPPGGSSGALSGCDPLVPEVCGLPWPSSLFEAEDPSTPTGRRLALTDTTLPGNLDGKPLQAAMFGRKDGFSTVGPMVAWFEDLSTDGLVGHDDLDGYLAADARTVVVDTVTHERVPHFAELDVSAEDPSERVLFLRPVVPLEHGRRYVVGLRNLTHTDGSPIAPSEAFVALRDGVASDLEDVESRRETFDGLVFPELEAQGFPRDELVLAWDFGTVSAETSIGPMVWMRDDALARAPSPAYVIDAVEDGACGPYDEPIARTVYGHFTSPRYTELDAPGTKLSRGPDGQPQYAGDTQVPFMVRVPCSLAADPAGGGPILQYGHGLLGNYDEARTGYLAALANANRWVIYAQNWTGMSSYDAGYITLMLSVDPSDFEMVPDRSMQGLTELVVGLRFARGALAQDPNLQFGGQPVIDAARTPRYYGNSQGGILGGAYAAISPDIERAVLGVAGGPYSLLLSRSADFSPFFQLLNVQYDDGRDVALLLTAFQGLWDPGEPGGYAWALTRDPLPGVPEKRYLLQIAVGDAQVTTLGAHYLARAIGAVSVDPPVREIWGVPVASAPIAGSAIAEWQYVDGPEEPVGNVPPDADLDTHECPRREPLAQQQLTTFLETGVVEQYCDGPCVSQRAGLCD